MKALFKCLTLLTFSLFGTAPSHADIIFIHSYNQLVTYAPVNDIAYVPTVYPAALLPISFALNTNTNDVHVGDAFDVDLVIHDLFANDPSDELLAFGFNALSSDTGLLKLTGSTINPLFSDDSVLLGLDAAGSAFPAIANNGSVSNPFTLATLHFQALAAGNGLINISSDLTDLNQGLFFLNQGQAAINASLSFTITAVPLPPAALFFISGVIMSIGAFRKRRGES